MKDHSSQSNIFSTTASDRISWPGLLLAAERHLLCYMTGDLGNEILP